MPQLVVNINIMFRNLIYLHIEKLVVINEVRNIAAAL